MSKIFLKLILSVYREWMAGIEENKIGHVLTGFEARWQVYECLYNNSILFTFVC